MSFNSDSAVITEAVLQVENVSVMYSRSLVLRDVCLEIPKNKIIAFIGPSGCGKSTLLRCFNRMNDLISGAKVKGKITFNGVDIYNPQIDPVEVRRRIGMVFQQPNPFPKSIYENIAYGARISGHHEDMNELVERSLRQAALWNEVKDKLNSSAFALSGGQQQRLCIARAVALSPQVILMDEPCSALDPISTLRIEELLAELKSQYTIIIVTHNMQQAARVSDNTAFFNAQVMETGNKSGYLVEYDETELIFNNPKQEDTQNYISGKFG